MFQVNRPVFIDLNRLQKASVEEDYPESEEDEDSAKSAKIPKVMFQKKSHSAKADSVLKSATLRKYNKKTTQQIQHDAKVNKNRNIQWWDQIDKPPSP